MKKLELCKVAQKIFNDLKIDHQIEYDDSGAIGKRYRRQDEIGTPFCITVDFDSLEDKMVTLRDRDNTKQERVEIKNIQKILSERIG